MSRIRVIQSLAMCILAAAAVLLIRGGLTSTFRESDVPIVLSPSVVDLSGESVPPGVPVAASFRVVNQSSSPVTLTSIRAGCTCAGVTPETPLPVRLAPGESLGCSVAITPQANPAPQSVLVVASCKAASNAGNDRKHAPDAVATITFRSPAPLLAQPSVITLGKLNSGEGITREVDILREKGRAGSLADMDVASSPGVSVEILSADGAIAEGTGEEDAYELACRLRLRIDPSQLDERISADVRVVDAAGGALTIPVFGWNQTASDPETPAPD